MRQFCTVEIKKMQRKLKVNQYAKFIFFWTHTTNIPMSHNQLLIFLITDIINILCSLDSSCMHKHRIFIPKDPRI